MKQIKFLVKTSSKKYPVIIGSNLTLKFLKILNENSINFEKCLLIIDKNIPKKLLSNIKKFFKKI